MNATVSLRLYELFIPLVKEETKAKEIVTNIEEIIENRFDYERDRLATKEDIANLRLELKTEIKEQKVDLIKWYVALFVMLALMIVGLYFK